MLGRWTKSGCGLVGATPSKGRRGGRQGRAMPMAVATSCRIARAGRRPLQGLADVVALALAETDSVLFAFGAGGAHRQSRVLPDRRLHQVDALLRRDGPPGTVRDRCRDVVCARPAFGVAPSESSAAPGGRLGRRQHGPLRAQHRGARGHRRRGGQPGRTAPVRRAKGGLLILVPRAVAVGECSALAPAFDPSFVTRAGQPDYLVHGCREAGAGRRCSRGTSALWRRVRGCLPSCACGDPGRRRRDRGGQRSGYGRRVRDGTHACHYGAGAVVTGVPRPCVAAFAARNVT